MIALIFWIFAASTIASAILVSYLRYGERLGIVKEKQTIMIAGTIILVISLIGFVYILLFTSYGTLEENPTWVPLLWLSILFIFIGVVIASFSIRAEGLGLLKKSHASKWFRIGYVIVILGSALLLYIFLPGNLVPYI